MHQQAMLAAEIPNMVDEAGHQTADAGGKRILPAESRALSIENSRGSAEQFGKLSAGMARSGQGATRAV